MRILFVKVLFSGNSRTKLLVGVNGCVIISSSKKWIIFHAKISSHPWRCLNHTWRCHSKWLTRCQNQKSPGKDTGLAGTSTGTTSSSPRSMGPEEKPGTNGWGNDGGGDETLVIGSWLERSEWLQRWQQSLAERELPGLRLQDWSGCTSKSINYKIQKMEGSSSLTSSWPESWELKENTWMDSQWWDLWRDTFCQTDLL